MREIRLTFAALLAVLALLITTAGAASEARLADAAEQQNLTALKTLLEQRADVNAAQADGMTALHWAVYYDDFETVKLLAAAGANVKAENRYGITPLSLACTNGNAEVVELLLDKGADANSALPGGETALMTASRTGRLGAVRVLLAHGAKVDARERKGQTALMWGAAEGNLEVVDALLDAGADFRLSLPSGFASLFFAVREGRTEVALRLLAAGADVNEVMRPRSTNATTAGRVKTPLILAVENGHFELAAALLKAGADPNARPAGYTALHAVTWVSKPIRGDGNPPPAGSGDLSSLDFVRKLVEHGANIDARLEKGESGRGRFTTTGSTPFLLAARANDVPLMRLLVEAGADPSIPNADKSSPLLAAAGVGALGDGDEAAGTEEEAIDAVRYLLELGADVNTVDNNGETAMHGAAYQSRAKLALYMAGKGADRTTWNRANQFGWTPLMIAQGHRPGNFRPSPDTIAAIEGLLKSESVTPSKVKPPSQP